MFLAMALITGGQHTGLHTSWIQKSKSSILLYVGGMCDAEETYTQH
jgi:hypothetical protein